MKDSNSLVKQSVRDVEALKKTSQTEAGPSKQQRNTTSGNVELQNAINQVFALFRINFHNQYHAAFGDTQLVNQAKKLWLESLARFTPQQVLMGARQIIEQSEYLPTLHRMINCCEEQIAGEGTPPLRAAYLEACSASSPKAAFNWSHPIVYHAGKQTGWYLLHNEPETVSFPRFRDCYRLLCRQLAEGMTFPLPETLLEETSGTPLDKDVQREHVKQLRSELKL
ncbi:MAG: replication protein P [Porticoccaceae bacterium]|nr:hypothetical protein [Pseudomonadales bacterium]